MARRNEGREYDEDGLTVQERRLIDLFFLYGNKARAAREAGFSAPKIVDGKRVRGMFRVFERPTVAMVIAREIAERRKRYTLEEDWVKQELAYLVRFDPRNIFNEDGSPKPMWELDEATAACISGIEIEDIYEGRGEDRQWVGSVRKYKFVSKTEAIALAMKHLNLLGTNDSKKTDRLHEVIAAFKAGPVETKRLPPTLEAE